MPDLLERLLEADRLTAEAEAHELALEAAWACVPRLGDEKTTQKWAAMLMRRHISRTDAGRTFSEVVRNLA
jgi:hypothetical protein